MKKFYIIFFFILIFSYSCCFASSQVFTEIDSMSPFIMEQIIEKIDNASSLYQNSSTAISNFNSFKNNFDIEQVCSTFNNFFSDKSIDYFENCSMMIGIYDSKFCLRVCQNNNTHHEIYPFIKIWARSSTETDFNYVDSNGNNVNNKPYYIVSFNSNGSLSYISTTAPYSRIGEVYGQSPTFVDSIVNCSYFISFNSIQNAVCYYINGNNAGFWGFVDNIVLLNESQPEEPSGEIGGLGYITNPSGENGGSINLYPINQSLNNIQNQISGDSQRIINNQIQNTEAIVNSINNSNSNYWGSEDDINEEDFEDSISDSLNNIMADISGEFQKNAVFTEMENAEDIFLDFFRNKQDDSFYDLVISWDSISPVISMYGGSEILSSSSIISGDSINISALCREDENLSTIQQYIRIIFNFSCIIALLWQIYNLVLSTLGIDNPYLYEDSSVNDVVNADTGEVHSYVRTRRRIFKKWW